MIRVYTLPNCPNCERLKDWLRDRGKEFETRVFDVLTHTNFVMRNVFGSPPILENGGGEVLVAEEIFKDDRFDTTLVEGFLDD